jgi:hypothetical protein
MEAVMRSFTKRPGAGLLPTLAVVLLASVTALRVEAAPVGASDAYGLGADLNILNVVSVSAGPFGAASGTSPGAYNNSNTVLSVDENLGLVSNLLGNYAQGLHTGVIETNANSSIPNATQAAASATINDLNLGLIFTPSLPLLDPLAILGLSADTIVSSSEVVDVGGLMAVGDTQIEGLGLSSGVLSLLGIDLGLAIDPGANTTLVDLLGLKIVLNEQITNDVGGNGLGLETNAIHISFDDFVLGALGLGAGLLNGDVYVGHTYAQVALLADSGNPANAVPEPAALGLFGVGLLGLGFGLRRRRGMGKA